MAPLIHHLISLSDGVKAESFVAALRGLSASEKPLWVGQCHHWIHDPRLSMAALTGSGSDLKKWDYLVISRTNGSLDIPPSIAALLADKWSVNAEVADQIINELPTKDKEFISDGGPALSEGWSAENHAALDASEPPAGVNLSLVTKAAVMGGDKKHSQIDVRTFVRNFGTSATGSGPIAMFNLLSFFPEQMPQYMNYISGFQEVLGPVTGGRPLTFGLEVHDWSSKEADKGDAGTWELVALVWYPTIWHFGQMLGDERYAKLDRDYKIGVVRDNPVLCCTPLELD